MQFLPERCGNDTHVIIPSFTMGREEAAAIRGADNPGQREAARVCQGALSFRSPRWCGATRRRANSSFSDASCKRDCPEFAVVTSNNVCGRVDPRHGFVKVLAVCVGDEYLAETFSWLTSL